MNDERWIGGIDTGPPCTGCGKTPSTGSAWSFYCSLHGGACGECKRKEGAVRCPVSHTVPISDRAKPRRHR